MLLCERRVYVSSVSFLMSSAPISSLFKRSAIEQDHPLCTKSTSDLLLGQNSPFQDFLFLAHQKDLNYNCHLICSHCLMSLKTTITMRGEEEINKQADNLVTAFFHLTHSHTAFSRWFMSQDHTMRHTVCMALHQRNEHYHCCFLPCSHSQAVVTSASSPESSDSGVASHLTASHFTDISI